MSYRKQEKQLERDATTQSRGYADKIAGIGAQTGPIGNMPGGDVYSSNQLPNLDVQYHAYDPKDYLRTSFGHSDTNPNEQTRTLPLDQIAGFLGHYGDLQGEFSYKDPNTGETVTTDAQGIKDAYDRYLHPQRTLEQKGPLHKAFERQLDTGQRLEDQGVTQGASSALDLQKFTQMLMAKQQDQQQQALQRATDAQQSIAASATGNQALAQRTAAQNMDAMRLGGAQNAQLQQFAGQQSAQRQLAGALGLMGQQGTQQTGLGSDLLNNSYSGLFNLGPGMAAKQAGLYGEAGNIYSGNASVMNQDIASQNQKIESGVSTGLSALGALAGLLLL